MSSFLTPFSAPLLAGGLLMVGLALMAWTRRAARGAAPLTLVCLAIAFYVIGYAGEISSHTVEEVRFWLKIEYLGIVSLPGLVLMTAAAYTGKTWFKSRLNMALLFFIPFITLLFAWTNETNEALWQNMRLDLSGLFTLTVFDKGPWYYVNTAYVLPTVIAAIVVLARQFIREKGLYRRQLGLMIVGLSLPFASYIIYQFDLIFPGLDLNAYAELIGITIVAWGMLSFQLLDVVPIAYDTVLTSMRDGMFVFDQRNRLVDLNDAARRINPKAAIGRPFSQVFEAWPDLEILPKIMPVKDETRMPIRHQERVYETTLTPIVGPKHARQGHLFMLRDTTEWMAAQIAIQEANERLGALRRFDMELSRKLKVSYVAEMGLDAAVRMSHADTGFIVLAENNALTLLHAVGPHPRQLFAEQVVPGKGIWARVMRTGEPELTLDVSKDADYVEIMPNTKSQITVPLKMGDKSLGLIVLQTARAHRFDEDGFEAVKLLAARISVSLDNAILYEERERLVQELEAFAHTVAHDLKNPLSVIKSVTEMLPKATTPERMSRMIATLSKGTDDAINIINALLLLARVRSAGDVEMSPIDMWSVVKNITTRFTPILEDTKANVSFPEDWPTASGYIPWVEEIWANYLSNAVKYGGTPPDIQLGWEEVSNDKFRFWVKDNGKGLTGDEIRQLFRPFTRLSAASAEGHGLGLSIVHRIAERLHGDVGVESSVGQGSKFFFTLPKQEAKEKAEAKEAEKAP